METAAQKQPFEVSPAPEQAGNALQPPARVPASTPKAKVRRKTNWSHRKAQLLPVITQLALEGHSGRSIALRFDVPIHSVNRKK